MCYDALTDAAFGEAQPVHRVQRWDDPEPPVGGTSESIDAQQAEAQSSSKSDGEGGLRTQMDAMVAALCMNSDALDSDEERIMCEPYSTAIGEYRDV